MYESSILYYGKLFKASTNFSLKKEKKKKQQQTNKQDEFVLFVTLTSSTFEYEEVSNLQLLHRIS